MDVDHIKVFIPSKDYGVSKRFYSQIGFKGEFVSDALTLFENGDCQFFYRTSTVKIWRKTSCCRFVYWILKRHIHYVKKLPIS